MPDDPFSARRTLGAELRAARIAAHLRMYDVAESTGWSPAKVSRMETGKARFTRADIIVLIILYRVDTEIGDRWHAMQAQARTLPVYKKFADILSGSQIEFFEAMGGADQIRESSTLVPVMLRTTAYARAVLKARGDLEEIDVERWMEFYSLVQLIREGSARSPMTFLLDEPALYRRCGTSDAMAEQLHALDAFAADPQVDVRVVPLSAGMFNGAGESYTLLDCGEQIVGVPLPHNPVLVIREKAKQEPFEQAWEAALQCSVPLDIAQALARLT